MKARTDIPKYMSFLVVAGLILAVGAFFLGRRSVRTGLAPRRADKAAEAPQEGASGEPGTHRRWVSSGEAGQGREEPRSEAGLRAPETGASPAAGDGSAGAVRFDGQGLKLATCGSSRSATPSCVPTWG